MGASDDGQANPVRATAGRRYAEPARREVAPVAPVAGITTSDVTRRPQVIVVAPESTFAALRDLSSGIVVHRADLADVAALAGRHHPRAIVVAGSPIGAAIEALLAVRATRRDAHLVLLTASGDSDERLRALEAGIDDALPPIPVEEIAGRVALLAHRKSSGRPTRLSVGAGLELDLERRELLRDGRWVHLRPKEAGLLELLARAPGRALTRQHILGRVWGPDHQGDPRTVDVHVRWLRDKIEVEPRRPERLVTVRGVGYRLEAPM